MAIRPTPALERAEQLRNLIGLAHVFVLPESRNGIAYVGFEFGCTWEEEHGLGVMTHEDRVIEIGSAETAFNGRRAARRDAESL